MFFREPPPPPLDTMSCFLWCSCCAFLSQKGRPRLSKRTPVVGLQAKEAVGSEGFAVGEEREQLFLSAASGR